MKLDLRLPLGLMFAIFGIMLTVYGILSDRAIYARSLGIDVNLWWGIVLLIFGIAMLALARNAARKARDSGGP
ncbi:MAG TPA: hypothetical protein VLD17_01345 [Gemmatimonadaceae bacterium]|nr:hypothetical protein [Gemmatimonadaceae bacterium]